MADGLNAIRRLAALATRLRQANDRPRFEPGALKELVDVARRHSQHAIEDFEDVARRSAALLPPLGEPLSSLNFSEHRWVGGQREEAYSDWLQWIVAQVEPDDVLMIFGVRRPEMLAAYAGGEVYVTREERVLYGHEGAEGRLDLKIEFGDAALVVVEVKVGEAEDADTAKNAGYCRSIEAACSFPLKVYLLLVTDAEKDDYCGFKPRLWSDVCIRLRLAAARLCSRKEFLRAAVILGFVAAVEQNLLKLRSGARSSDNSVAAALALPRITDHLNKFVEAAHDGKAECN